MPVVGEPELQISTYTESILLGTSILAGGCGILLAFYMYITKPELPGKLVEMFPRTYNLLLNKYFIDEIYIGGLVEPTLTFSRKILLKIIDVGIIEGIVNGVPNGIGAISSKLRGLQDGQISHYLAWMGGSALFIFVWMFTR